MTEPAVGQQHPEADQILDCSGLKCPLPIYKASLALGRLGQGQILELICTDPGSINDIPALARQGKHELLRNEVVGNTQRFWLRKGGAS